MVFRGLDARTVGSRSPGAEARKQGESCKCHARNTPKSSRHYRLRYLKASHVWYMRARAQRARRNDKLAFPGPDCADSQQAQR